MPWFLWKGRLRRERRQILWTIARCRVSVANNDPHYSAAGSERVLLGSEKEMTTGGQHEALATTFHRADKKHFVVMPLGS